MASSRLPQADHQRVQVVIRCRPEPTRSSPPRHTPALAFCADDPRLLQMSMDRHGNCRQFCFDRVFPPHSTTQENLFQHIGQPAIDDILAGINRTILAYGQTGSGKSYSLGVLANNNNNNNNTCSRQELGLIPRCLEYLFHSLGDFDFEDTGPLVTLSCCQLYLNTLYDLFAPDSSQRNIQSSVRKSKTTTSKMPKMRHHATTGFFVQGIEPLVIRNVDEAQALVNLAMSNRITAATKRNATSSRSHVVLTLTLHHRPNSNATVNSPSGSTVLQFVDLAGSERCHPTMMAKGTRFQEAKEINTSLSALGNVISALAAASISHNKKCSRQSSPSQYIRYRDSTLTKLLEPSFQGQGRICLLATIDEHPKNITETLSTLKFATKCQKILKIPPRRKSKPSNPREDIATALAAAQRRVDEEKEEEHERREKLVAHFRLREEVLHRQYQEKINSLLIEEGKEEQLKEEMNAMYFSLCDTIESMYFALCDLANVSLGDELDHPELGQVQMSHYVSEMYDIILEGLLATRKDDE